MKFSIISPSFNQLDWLRLCIASVADQTSSTTISNSHLPSSISSSFFVEHIIQDAGTPGIEDFAREVGADFYRDGTLIFKSPFSALSPQVSGLRSQASVTHPPIPQLPSSSCRYRLSIYSGPDGGMYDAINRGLRRSDGDFCTWLNSDEQYLPGTLDKVAGWFREHPEKDILFGDAVVTDAAGNYRCSRSALLPQRWHTMVSGNLSFLSAATFFRRKIVLQGLLLPEGWRVVGDAVWAAELIRAKAAMGVWNTYLSAFADTGDNLTLNAQARKERDLFASHAPAPARWLSKGVILHYRLRKWIAGAYDLKPFEYQIHTLTNPGKRAHFRVLRPVQRWTGRSL